jgi:cysteine desulfurase
VIFTSCGTESINSALASGLASRPDRRHLVTTSVEHPATLKFCRMLERLGYEVTRLPVSEEGLLDLERFEACLRPETAVVSVMWANNETGVLFPVRKIATLCRSRGIWLHTDAIQVPGKLPIHVRELGVDFLSLSGHKFHGPKGVGLLYVRHGTPFEPYVQGGHQERDRRGGTENVPGIVALGRAAELAVARLPESEPRVRALRDRLEEGVLRLVPGCRRNGSPNMRLANTANLAFDGVDAEAAVLALDAVGICVSTGSACAAGSVEPSHVLTAMGLSPRQARGSLRFSLGADSTNSDVDAVLSHLPRIIDRVRAVLPSGAS